MILFSHRWRVRGLVGLAVCLTLVAVPGLAVAGALRLVDGVPGHDEVRQYSRQTMERLKFDSWDCSQSRNVAFEFNVESAGEYFVHVRPRLACGKAYPYLPSWPELLDVAACLSDMSFAMEVVIIEHAGEVKSRRFAVNSMVLGPLPEQGGIDVAGVTWLIASNDLRLGPVLVLQGEGVELAPGKSYALELSLDPRVQVGNGLRVTVELVRFDSSKGE